MGNAAYVGVSAYRINSKLEFLKKEESYDNTLPPYSQDEKTKHHLFNFCAVKFKNEIKDSGLRRSNSKRTGSVKSLTTLKSSTTTSDGKEVKASEKAVIHAEAMKSREDMAPNDEDLPVDAKGFLLVVIEITKDEVIFRDPKKLTKTVHSCRFDEIKKYESSTYGYRAKLQVVYSISSNRESIEILCDMADKFVSQLKLEINNYANYLNSLFAAYEKDIGKGTARNFTKLTTTFEKLDLLVNMTVSKDSLVVYKCIDGESENKAENLLHRFDMRANEACTNIILWKFNCVENNLDIYYMESKFKRDDNREEKLQKISFHSNKCAEVGRVLEFTSDYLKKEKAKEDKKSKKNPKK